MSKELDTLISVVGDLARVLRPVVDVVAGAQAALSPGEHAAAHAAIGAAAGDPPAAAPGPAGPDFSQAQLAEAAAFLAEHGGQLPDPASAAAAAE